VVVFVVARDRRDLYEYLDRGLADEPRFEVLVDRRQDERRRHRTGTGDDRRQGERRSIDISPALVTLGYAIAKTPDRP
jgi:hypothetical protein